MKRGGEPGGQEGEGGGGGGGELMVQGFTARWRNVPRVFLVLLHILHHLEEFWERQTQIKILAEVIVVQPQDESKMEKKSANTNILGYLSLESGA